MNKWVEEQLEGFSFESIRDKKVIRDAPLDTNRFFEWEINTMDLPIVQRLRRIAQTGFAFFTYPSATHNRFEHTLGVLVIATKFANAIKDKEELMMDGPTLRELRLAAILHDVGHGPFSHVSESIYSDLPDVDQELKTNLKFSKCKGKPHEMLSYMIVKSKCFQNFFYDNLQTKKYQTNIDLNTVADLIVGDMEKPLDAYKSDIINGAFDADKLDYLARDCYFTGLKMGIDIDRIMYTISIDKKKKFGRQGIMIDISGAPFVEQVLFNKMLLYTSIYHHHKVRTLECMFKSIFEAIYDYKLKINGFPFDKVTDFLSVTDPEMLTLEGKPDEIKPLIENIRNRSLLKRALVISRDTIKKPEGIPPDKVKEFIDMKYQSLIELDSKQIRQLRDLIVEEVGRKITPYDVWIDLPAAPSFRESSQTVIKITDERRETLDKIFPTNKWLIAYAENKWKGHVFCPPLFRPEINKASQKIFKEHLDVKFNDYATSFAKIF